ncbi:hypothetical protein EW026_g2705 [Hermanssonia centrifuga]|uniref:Uncharacterized protein n=2 Tax=Hermanssonia centrifuga TaxID=98765 RepID=A0A2R6NDP4_9APHY|nr:hypothetical protein PHLCEN_2v13638 [Hermanssonia centrifuga]THG99684.1 hypothetical protein EW026_g2705 [Hermanssonia centrifuga]
MFSLQTSTILAALLFSISASAVPTTSFELTSISSVAAVTSVTSLAASSPSVSVTPVKAPVTSASVPVTSAISTAAVASAVPTSGASIKNLQPHQFDVYTPHITSPKAAEIWRVGENHTVTWNVASLDPQGLNTTGYLLLGYLENDSENLDIQHPLAHNFLLGDGTVDLTVPNVTTRDDYIVVLLGDSGNTSPTFIIQNSD